MQSFAVRVIVVATMLTVVGVSACGDPAHVSEENELGEAEIEISAAERAAAEARVQAQADSIDRKLRKVPNLTLKEKRGLLRDVNEIQVARAKKLGISPGAPVEKLTEAGKLVQLADTTPYWIIRELTYSVPYVTPSTEALLIDIGRRFHERLDSLGIPRYRLDITSVLRTPEKQSALRKANRNASRTVSAHEFGTTVDIAYRHYAPPEQDSIGNVALDAATRLVADSVLVEVSHDRSAEMQAVLGRVLREMQQEGLVLVRMEKRQTVYHITVGKEIPRPSRAGGT